MPTRPTTLKPLRIAGTISKHNAVQPRRKTTAERGYDYGWQQLRALFLLEYPLCKRCDEDDDRAVPATDVDHKIDIAKRPDLRLEWDNLQSLCKSHHGRKTRIEQNNRYRALSVGSIKKSSDRAS